MGKVSFIYFSLKLISLHHQKKKILKAPLPKPEGNPGCHGSWVENRLPYTLPCFLFILVKMIGKLFSAIVYWGYKSSGNRTLFSYKCTYNLTFHWNQWSQSLLTFFPSPHFWLFGLWLTNRLIWFWKNTKYIYKQP